MSENMSPSSERRVLSSGQIGKFEEVFGAGLRKANLPSGGGQIVLETQMNDLVLELVALVRKRIEASAGIIDCDSLPSIPDHCCIEEHQKGGSFQWDPAQVALYLSSRQSRNKKVKGHNLQKDLSGRPLMNACILDFLLLHRELIPEDWKGKRVYFWGTKYRDDNGELFVRALWLGSPIPELSKSLRFDWGILEPAALLLD
jgi:hypothetical protein